MWSAVGGEALKEDGKCADGCNAVRSAVAEHVRQRGAVNCVVDSEVIDVIHPVFYPHENRERFGNAGESMVMMAENLVRPNATSWLTRRRRCKGGTCKTLGDTSRGSARLEYAMPTSGAEALRLIDEIQDVVTTAGLGSRDMMGASLKKCTVCRLGFICRCDALEAEAHMNAAPEFFVVHLTAGTSAKGGFRRIDYAGTRKVKFPPHDEQEEGPDGSYRVLCYVEHKDGGHYITKMNIGVALAQDVDAWCVYDGTKKECELVREGERTVDALQPCFAVFVRTASVLVSEQLVISDEKSQHRKIQARETRVVRTRSGRAGKKDGPGSTL